jgi:hypothetical protein
VDIDDAMKFTKKEDQDYEEDYADFLSGFGRMDKRIDKMNELKRRVKVLTIKTSEKLTVDQEFGEFYTTKHYYYGLHIKKVLREYVAYQREQDQESAGEIELAPGRSPLPTPENVRELEPTQAAQTTHAADAHLPSIVEQPSAYEQTGQLSKNNAGGPHHAINEADEKNTQIP